MHVLFKSIFYFYKFYVMEPKIYFALKNIYNLIKRSKLHNYNVVLYKWRICY